MSVFEIFRGVVDESVEATELALGINGVHLEPRCRVCRNDQVRTKVNDLLATGASYAMVLRAVADDNATLEQRDRVTIDSIRNHAGRQTSRFSRWPAPPTARSWSVGLKKTASTSSRACLPRSPRWPSWKPGGAASPARSRQPAVMRV